MNSQQSNMKEQVIWEEKNSIEPSKNSKNNLTIVPNDTTNEIKNKYVKDECKDIGKKWVKKCPECGDEMSYSSEPSLKRSIKNNSICNKCYANSLRLPPQTDGWSKNCPECGDTIIFASQGCWFNSKKNNSKCKKCRVNALRLPVPVNGWSRECPSCKNTVIYTQKSHLEYANKHNSICRDCFEMSKMPVGGWVKHCPECNELQEYGTKKSLDAAFVENKICQKCTQALRKAPTPENGWVRICENCQHEDKYLNQYMLTAALKRSKYCQPCNKKLGIRKWERKCPECNSDIKYLSRDGYLGAIKNNSKCNDCVTKIYGAYLMTRYNPSACVFMDVYGSLNGYIFQHAKNIREYQVGRYFLDGYDKDKNVVFEYDEQQHFRGGKLMPKDIVRQSKIIEMIHPTAFFRYNEPKKILTEVISGKEIKL